MKEVPHAQKSESPRRQADGGGARIKEGAASQPYQVSEAAPKLALLSFPRSSKGRMPAVTSEAIQVRILAGEPRISRADCCAKSTGPGSITSGLGPEANDRIRQYSLFRLGFKESHTCPIPIHNGLGPS